ncbi:MAG: 1-phosphofructokinase family hexose kinase, partial [Brachybacterium sp.]
MIITLTANPSLDRTVDLGGPLTPGGVHRIGAESTQPGGKGINVALGVHRAGLPVLAVLPAAPSDPLLTLLEADGLP